MGKDAVIILVQSCTDYYNLQGIKRDFRLKDATGKTLRALKVFALCIQWLKDDLLSEWKTRLPGTIKDDDVHWMLTVPAIWSEAAKQFMRTAAQEVHS